MKDAKSLRDCIQASMLLVAIGDALGMPVEILSAEKIRKRFGRIIGYIDPPKDHLFHSEGMTAGKWTDDWCHTQACADSIISCAKHVGRKSVTVEELFVLSEIASQLVEDSRMLVSGMGGSTREALERVRNGVHWSASGTAGGAGNGVAMKAAPFGILLASMHKDVLFDLFGE